MPHYILEAITSSDDAHEDAKNAAHATISLTQILREVRHLHIASLHADADADTPAGTSPPPEAIQPPHPIVPPHVLESIAAAESAQPEGRAGALHTLSLTEELRAKREQLSEALHSAEEALVGPGPPRLQRLVYNCEHKQQLPGTPVRIEGQDPVEDDETLNECYDGLGVMFKFCSEVFHRNSIDNAGMNLIGSVHYSSKYNNAFWNGHQMVFGDGDGVYFNRFTLSIDVIGHELAHGVTARTANLAYAGQSGALNESISDVFGSMVKQYHLGQTAQEADWLIGEGLYTKNVKGAALRSMKAPGTAYDDPVLGKDPQPATFDKYVNSPTDSGGVHVNSGIPNHAFYIVAVGLGGHSWDRAGRIWYATLKDKRLKPRTDFKHFADLTCDNASKAYGEEVEEVVKQAWTDVGVYSAPHD
jgi:Zn-dependent metalloprotease